MVVLGRQPVGAHAMLRRVGALMGDDSGQDLLEYALLSAFIGVVGALIFPAIVEEMGVAYESWITGADLVFDPPAPGS
jgi:hypothetical protein